MRRLAAVVPDGTFRFLGRQPSTEVLGYFRSSLRDCGNAHRSLQKTEMGPTRDQSARPGAVRVVRGRQPRSAAVLGRSDVRTHEGLGLVCVSSRSSLLRPGTGALRWRLPRARHPTQESALILPTTSEGPGRRRTHPRTAPVARIIKPAGRPATRNASARRTRPKPCGRRRFGNRRYSRFGNLRYGGSARMRSR